MDRYNSCEMGGIVRENNSNSNKRSHETTCEDQRLDLKLGPPGENKPLLSFHNYLSPHNTTTAVNNNSTRNITAKREFLDTIIEEKSWLRNKEEYQSGLVNVNAILNMSSKKRIDVRPVVGWPPVRTSRKNIFSSNKNIATTKIEITDSLKKVGNQGAVNGEGKDINENSSSLFVKIKMDGVAIGRKIDLKSYTNYDNLSSAVDQLFRGLLAAQGDLSSSQKENMEKAKTITGLLDGSGDYTLVYEDNEGDRMLVGDVPWSMFISSAKRLRVLKKSELSTLNPGVSLC